MCGIIGYTGDKQVLPILIDGLKKLEYRGYDSAGLAIINNKKIESVKSLGKIIELEKKTHSLKNNLKGETGIAHTRWATHGEPSEHNAHPHSDSHGKIWVAHNGIIENYKELKEKLAQKGHVFKSETDTEIIAHLLEDLDEDNFSNSIQNMLQLIKGAYAFVIIHANHPDKIWATRFASPLIIGASKDETLIASDVSAIIKYTRNIIYLDDKEIAEIQKDDIKIFNSDNKEIKKTPELIEWNIEQAEKGNFPHFLIKEIFEQKETIQNSIRGRTISKIGKAKLGGLEAVKDKLKEIDKIIITGMGTAYCAGIVGKYMLEEYAGIFTTTDLASEFRYRKPKLDQKTALLAISQSGETADTLAAIKEAKEKDILTLGIVNVVGSFIARDTNAGIYNHVGPEISVASTKAFTSQISILALLTVFLGRQRDMSLTMGKRIIDEILVIDKKVDSILKLNEKIKEICEKYAWAENFAFIGRKYNMATAYEGAIKLKEISYIHAEGFAAGELKHHSIALIDKKFPSIFIIPEDSVYDKNLSSLIQIKSRNGKVIAITTEGNKEIEKIADDVIYIPKTLEMLTPILAIIPLQFFAYHMAILKKCDVDKPRNLAKSVTVE